MDCPLYDEHRAELLVATEQTLQSPVHKRHLLAWRQGASGPRFDILMALEDKAHLGRLARHLHRAWQDRTAYLAAHLGNEGLDSGGVVDTSDSDSED